MLSSNNNNSLSIVIPKEVEITWGVNFVKIKGPLGTVIKQKGNLEFAIENSRLYLLSSSNEEKDNEKKLFHLSLLRALIIGVSKGYKQKLRLVGVGYRAQIIENNLEHQLSLKIGYSHEVIYPIPSDIDIVCSKAKGTTLLIKGIELYRVRQVASEIRALHVPDAYKGKGIHYNKEVLKLKKGKREGK